VKSKMGVPFGKCIKPGMDNKGHPMIRSAGAFAGDADSYSTFQELFLPIALACPGRDGGYDPGADGAAHPMDLTNKVVAAGLGSHVVSSRIKVYRCLDKFRFPSAISRDERRQVEELVTKVCADLTEDLAGQYLPLEGSGSYAAKPRGMASEDAAELEADGLLFREPDSSLVLSTGVGRHWPEARGIFVTPSAGFSLWVNEEEHLRLASTAKGPNSLQEAYGMLCRAEGAIQAGLQLEGHGYAHSKALGFLTSDPWKLGTGGFQVSVLLKLPLLSAVSDFKAKCKALNVVVRAKGSDDVWSISASAKLGQGEANVAEKVAAACRSLIDEEVKLAQGNA